MKEKHNKSKEKLNKLSRRDKIIFLSLIILLTIVTFSNSVFNELISYDDPGYITVNELIRGLSFHNLQLIFSSFVMGNYHPFVVLCDAVIFHFSRLNPMPYHALSLFIHVLNVILVFQLTFLLISNYNSPKSLPASSLQLPASALVAVLFAIHPMHCETVCWASDLKDLLFTFFYLASLIYYIKYLKSTVHSPQSTDKSLKTQNSKLKTQKLKQQISGIIPFSHFHISTFYLISLILFAGSCLSKSAAVTLPLIMLATDYLLNRKISIMYVLEKIPFFILSIVFGIINIYSQASNIYPQSSAKANFNLSNYNIADRLFFPLYNTAYYAVSTIFPYKLSVIHPYPLKTGGFLPIEYYLFPLIMVLILFFIIKSFIRSTDKERQTNKALIFGILFFIINLALVLQIIPVGTSIVSERYSYLSYFGIFFIVGIYYLSLMSQKFRQNTNIIVITIVLIFAFFSHERNKVWANNLTLYNDVLEKYPVLDIAYETRALAKINLQDREGALLDFTKAIEINPHYASAFYNRGLVKEEFGNHREAIDDYNNAIINNPKFGAAFYNRGVAKNALGDYNGALEDYTKAIELNPKDTNSFYNRGLMKGMNGDYKGAIIDFDRLIELSPKSSRAYNNRANAKYYLGDKEGACLDWKKSGEFGFILAYDMINKYCK